MTPYYSTKTQNRLNTDKKRWDVAVKLEESRSKQPTPHD